MTNQIDKDINTIADWMLEQEFLKDEIVWLLQQRYANGENHNENSIRDDYDNVLHISWEDE